MPHDRFDRLPWVEVDGLEVPVAAGFRARLLGLALLDRADAGPGLLIPRCSSVHTFGMRFALDLHFLDPAGAVVAVRRAVPPRRLAGCRGDASVLELPAEPTDRVRKNQEKGSRSDPGPLPERNF